MNQNIRTIINSTNIRVRYAETDKMGIVYNSNYLVYFEVARVELMRSCGLSYIEFENAGFMLPLVESHVNYYTSALFDDELRIEAILNFEMKATMRIDYNIYRDDTTIAKGYTVHSFMSSLTRKPVRPPKIFIDSLTDK
jgi:acyl-CoA thioester hydrolase